MFLSSRSNRSVWPHILAPLLAGLLLAAAFHGPSQAAPNLVYVISDHEGYGVVECLTKKSECGKVVADSWCEAHGHGPARAYGPADDITASIGPAAGRPAPTSGAAIVSCQE